MIIKDNNPYTEPSINLKNQFLRFIWHMVYAGNPCEKIKNRKIL